MPFIGSILPAKVVALDRDEKKVRKSREDDAADAKASFREVLDEADLSVAHVESVDGDRRVEGNGSEQSHEDRISHPMYDAHASRRRPPSATSRRLDLEG